MTPRTTGLLIGLLMSGVSLAGNMRRVDTFSVSVYPDLLSVFVLPVAMYFVLRQRDRKVPGQTVRALRKAGWSAVNAASVVFAVWAAGFTAVWLAQSSVEMVSMSLLAGLVLSAGLGYLSVEVWARSIVHARTI